ncbi:Nitrate/nitrite response regulator protein [gamma proteobacterium IMCC2047]|nr:Nitrate/nitrite response regulator protein [gamma proteobacterium IMCC2047]
MTNSTAHSIILVDDHPLFRKGVAQLVEDDKHFTLAGEASNAKDGIALAEQLNPDVILMDLNMKEMNGIEALTELRARGITAVVVIFTVSNHEKDILAAMKAGADGYLLKDCEPEDLMEKLRLAATGKSVLDDELVQIVTHALRENKPTPPSSKNLLTARERDILDLLAACKSNKVIANELGITDGTVKVHVKNLLRKLNLKSRIEAAVWALENQDNS